MNVNQDPGRALGDAPAAPARRRPAGCSLSAATPRRHRGDRARRPGSRGARSTTTSTARRELLRRRLRADRARDRRADRGRGVSAPGAGALETLRPGPRPLPRSLPRAGGAADRAARRARGPRLGAVARDRRPLRARPDRGVADGRDGNRRDPPRSRCDPLAHALLGALDEVAMLVARAEDPAEARAEAGETLRRR